jgi:AcrR family transcriptional regulator
VSRWQPDARERLERAAIELFTEKGFAATTVPEITARAGLTTRTFFRHFADKREVLFGGEAISGLADRFLADVPADADPVTLIITGLTTAAETRFEGRRAELRQRWAIVRSDDSLRERELRKWDAVREATRHALLSRGATATTAALLADTSVSVFQVSLEQWLDQDGERPLAELITGTFQSLRTALTTSGPERG